MGNLTAIFLLSMSPLSTFLWNVPAVVGTEIVTPTGTIIVIGSEYNTSYTCEDGTWFSTEMCPGMGINVKSAVYGRNGYIIKGCTDTTPCDIPSCNDCTQSVKARFSAIFAYYFQKMPPSVHVTTNNLISGDICKKYKKFVSVEYSCVGSLTWTTELN